MIQRPLRFGALFAGYGGLAAARTTGPARFYRLPPGEKRDVLAQPVARLYPTGQP